MDEGHWLFYVLGCRGSCPVSGDQYREFGGATSCYILKKRDHAIVLDCGSGLSQARELLADCSRIDILLTHIHYDHIIGLLNWGVFPKGAKLRFFGRFNDWLGADTLSRFIAPPFWPYTPDLGEIVPVDVPGEAELHCGVRVLFYPACHPDSSSLLRIETEDGAVCAAFDNEHGDVIPEYIGKNCALLLYDAMYTKEEYPDHIGWGHSYWQEGCETAKRLCAARLLITHHAADRTDAQLLEMERAALEDNASCRFVRAGDVFDLRGSK